MVINPNFVDDLEQISGPYCLMAVGLPCSGKSTTLERFSLYLYGGNMRWLSTDSVIDEIADATGLTYNELFEYKDIFKIAERVMYKYIDEAIEINHSFAWDQTNLSVASRHKKLNYLPKNYKKIALVFEQPQTDILEKRLVSRQGKSIPKHVMDSMIKSYQAPTIEEGFDIIYNVATFEKNN